MKSDLKGFASDNYAGVHPDVMQALQDVNHNHVPAYGQDIYTEQAYRVFKRYFGEVAQTFFVFSGTGANVLALDVITRPFNSIICAETAHINVDECGAIAKVTGASLIHVQTPNGKLTPELVQPYLKRFGDEHHAQPKVISISQTTEYGTVYTPAEIRALAELAHRHDMYLHVDGARICNAAAALSGEFRSFTTDAGVDVLSFGGTKNGMMFGEAVIFLNAKLAEHAKFYRKQNGMLLSKHRFIAVQFLSMLEGELWLRCATQANAMASRLADGVRGIKGVEITQPVQANVVFARLPEHVIRELQSAFAFYVWNEFTHEVRWMTSFDTTPEEVDRFIAKIKTSVQGT